MTESQSSQGTSTDHVPVLVAKPSRPSILHKLDLLLHARASSEDASNDHGNTHLSFSTATYVRGVLELLCLGASLALEIYLINETQNCFPQFADYKYSVLVAFCAVLATLSKVLIFFVRWTKKVRSLISEVRLNLWKAVIAISYCSHNLPLLLIDADTCEGNSRLFDDRFTGLTAVQWFVIVWYTLLSAIPVGLFLLTKCSPKSFATMRSSESLFWTCVRVAQALEALLYVFTTIVMVSLLDSGIGVIYVELVTSCLYLGYSAYLMWSRCSAREDEKAEKEAKVKEPSP